MRGVARPSQRGGAGAADAEDSTATAISWEERLWDHSAPPSTRRIIAAALEAFAERGYHGTTTRDIAARADLSSAGIYTHYRSKAELLELIIRASHEEVLEQMRVALDGADDSVERMRSLVKAHVGFHARRHTAARVANHEIPALQPRAQSEILALRAEIERLVEDTIRLGVVSGDFKVEDMRSATFAILSIGIGVSRWFRGDGRLSPDRLGDLYANLVIRMLTAPTAQKAPKSSQR